MAGVRCAFCHAPVAPFGFGLPGLRADLPEDLRDKRIWTCASEDCRRQAEAHVARVRKERGLG